MSKTLLPALGAGASAFAAVTASPQLSAPSRGTSSAPTPPWSRPATPTASASERRLQRPVDQEITLSNNAGTSQGNGSGTVDTNAATLTLSADTPVTAVTRAVVVISGGGLPEPP